MSAYDELMTALLVERYDNRWWKSPPRAEVNLPLDLLCDLLLAKIWATDSAVVVEIGREAS